MQQLTNSNNDMCVRGDVLRYSTLYLYTLSFFYYFLIIHIFPVANAMLQHDDNEILSKYQFGMVLGEYVSFTWCVMYLTMPCRGAYSEVFLATNKQTGEKVAIKRILKLTKDEMWTRRKGAQKDEIKLLMLLNHPKVIKFKEFFETRDKLYIVQE